MKYALRINGITSLALMKLDVLSGLKEIKVCTAYELDGQTIKGDARRIRGIHANAAMRVDPYLKNTTLIDVYGGSAVFYDSHVKLLKV